MITVKWLGVEREIPGYGVGHTGKQIKLPDDLAEKLINQGKAAKIKKANTKIEEK